MMINANIDVQDIIKSLDNYEESLDLIKEIDKNQEDWGFTLDAFRYFLNTIKETYSINNVEKLIKRELYYG
jgi:hypothetical protein